ncbi:MAG: hypothetical protein ACRDZX_05875 [Acidimicrobiales bacterium]
MRALEELRYLARGWESDGPFPAEEVAGPLAELAEQGPAMLVHACRRLIEHFPGEGVAWWLSARALSSPCPADAIWTAAEELAGDPTARLLVEALPGSAAVSSPGPSYAVARALRRRRHLRHEGPSGGVPILVISARAAGPGAVAVEPRAAAGARDAGRAGQEVWAVVERGALLPEALWARLLARAGSRTATVAADVVTTGVGDRGAAPLADLLSTPTCPPVAELLGWKS